METCKKDGRLRERKDTEGNKERDKKCSPVFLLYSGNIHVAYLQPAFAMMSSSIPLTSASILPGSIALMVWQPDDWFLSNYLVLFFFLSRKKKKRFLWVTFLTIHGHSELLVALRSWKEEGTKIVGSISCIRPRKYDSVVHPQRN